MNQFELEDAELLQRSQKPGNNLKHAPIRHKRAIVLALLLLTTVSFYQTQPEGSFARHLKAAVRLVTTGSIYPINTEAGPDDTVQTFVTKFGKDTPIVFYFCKETTKHCKSFFVRIKNFARKYKNLAFVEVDTGKNSGIAGELGVKHPGSFVLVDGQDGVEKVAEKVNGMARKVDKEGLLIKPESGNLLAKLDALAKYVNSRL